MRAAVERTGLDPARIDDVIFGDANQAGEDNRDVARFGALLAGFPSSVPGVTVNRLCGSSVEAVIQGSRAIEAGDADIILAGGVESMSRAPYRRREAAEAVSGGGQPDDVEHLDRVADDEPGAAQGLDDLERRVRREARARSTASRARSRTRSRCAATASRRRRGRTASTTARSCRSTGTRSPAMRASATTRRSRCSAALRALFAADGTVTAGNSSPINDGASAILLGAEGALDAEPLARITGRGVFGNDPDVFGVAPVEAANRALARAGRTWADVDFVELNEAFASQSLACVKLWDDLDPESVNIHGGAIAIGHPLGASGGRIIGHAAHELARRGGGVAVAAICIGVGQGLAVVLER